MCMCICMFLCVHKTYMCVSLCGYEHVSTDASSRQKVLDPQELELEVTASHPMWVLGTILGHVKQ